MSKVLKKWISDNAVGASQFRAENNTYVRARNNADSGDVNVFKVNASDVIEFASFPEKSGTPSTDDQLVNRGYVLSLIAAAGQAAEWQDSVIDRFDPTSATPVGPSTGDRYLSTATANGWTVNYIYEWNGSSWDETIPTTGTYLSVDDETDGIYYFGGSSWTKKEWENTTASTGLTKSGVDIQLADAVASNGIQVSSGAISVVVDDSSIEIASNQIQVKALGITNAMLAGSIADDKLVEDYIKTSEVDGSTIEFAGGSLNVKASGIGETELNNIDGGVDAQSFVIPTGYAASAGTVAAGDTIDAAIRKLDGNIAANVGSQNATETITLIGDDITNGYVDLAQEAISASVQVTPKGGILQSPGEDFSLSVESSVTRITFSGDLSSGLEAGDKLIIYYEY